MHLCPCPSLSFIPLLVYTLLPPPRPHRPLQAKLLEHNVRFGDPECQGLMMRCDSDLTEALLAATQGGEVDRTGGEREGGGTGPGGRWERGGLNRGGGAGGGHARGKGGAGGRQCEARGFVTWTAGLKGHGPGLRALLSKGTQVLRGRDWGIVVRVRKRQVPHAAGC